MRRLARAPAVTASTSTCASALASPGATASTTEAPARGAFFNVLRFLAFTAATAADAALCSSHDSGRNNRQSSGHDAVSVTAWTLTPIWQFATRPRVPEYWRATPGE